MEATHNKGKLVNRNSWGTEPSAQCIGLGCEKDCDPIDGISVWTCPTFRMQIMDGSPMLRMRFCRPPIAVGC